MARLKHRDTGVVVEVSDETAANLGSEWQPEKSEPKTARKPSTAKK